MSCCGGKCGCGDSCGCGSGCGGCKKYPDLFENAASPTVSLIAGVAPKAMYFDGVSEMSMGGENGGCKCGPDCTCNPCNCK